jgi:isopenicillin-N epimerase
VRAEFLLDPDVVFLNHGSFGACPRPVFKRYQAWQRELERQPVEFIARRLPGLLAEARAALGAYVGADPDDLVFVPNATSGVNLAARALELRPGDEVLSTDLEYGACDLVWEDACARAGATYVRAKVELPLESPDDVVEQLFAHAGERTRAVFVSHITSETAAVLPLVAIVARARALGLVTIVDGAHAPGHVALDLSALGIDLYAGNCHKWMCAPKGAGFLAVQPAWQDAVRGLIVSWGHGPDATFRTRNELQGTRDPSSYLAVPAAIDWLAAHDWPRVQERCRALVADALVRLSELDGVEPVAASPFRAQMASVRVPTDDPDELKRRLYDEHRVEVPVFARKTEPLLRLSIAAYNESRDVDALVAALNALVLAE